MWITSENAVQRWAKFKSGPTRYKIRMILIMINNNDRGYLHKQKSPRGPGDGSEPRSARLGVGLNTDRPSLDVI